MCKDCGCSITGHHHEEHHHHHEQDVKDKKVVEVIQNILDKNDKQAMSNRRHFEEHGVFCINLMSSPGSGKTSLLEATIEELKDKIRIGVIEGDLETNYDAIRIKEKGAKSYQITTGQACHLDAFMVHEGIHNLGIEDLDIVFIENVGNLVCPAAYDVGSHMNVVLFSTAEGEDKPVKYPVMFKSANVVVITKTDLLQYLDFDIQKAKNYVKEVNPQADIIALSAKTKENLEKWLKYLEFKLEMFRNALA
ncbi:hydrogenase nickel incorporation protein HypB [Hydrogenobaculum acidophilum]